MTAGLGVASLGAALQTGQHQQHGGKSHAAKAEWDMHRLAPVETRYRADT